MSMAAAEVSRKWTWLLPLILCGGLGAVENGTREILARSVDMGDEVVTPVKTVGESASIAGALGSVAVATVLVVGLMLALAWFLRRYGRRLHASGGGRHLAVVETLPLGLKRSVSLLRCGDRFLVLGQSEQGLSALAELPASAFAEEQAAEAAAAAPREDAPVPPADAASAVDGFKQRLQALRGGIEA
jgi:flagellar protein FliO/FliZ